MISHLQYSHIIKIMMSSNFSFQETQTPTVHRAYKITSFPQKLVSMTLSFSGGVNISSHEMVSSPGTFKITYSQLKDRSSVQMKHVVVELPTTPGETNINVLFQRRVTEVHRDNTVM